MESCYNKRSIKRLLTTVGCVGTMNQRPKDYGSSTAQDYVRNRSGVPLHPERDRFFEGGLQMPAFEYSAWKLERARKRSIFE